MSNNKVRYYHLRPNGIGNEAITARAEVVGNEVHISFAFFSDGRKFARKQGREKTDQKFANKKVIERPFTGTNSFAAVLSAYREVPKPKTFANIELDRYGRQEPVGFITRLRRAFRFS